MRTAAVVAVVTLALSAMLWAADDTVIAPQQGATVAPTSEKTVSAAGTITIPQMMTYQGKLTDATGVPVHDGSYSVAFRLYTVPAGGSPFWNETQSVTTRDGLFSVLLGSVTPIGTGVGGQGTGVGAAYLGMAVAGDNEMMPRLRIAGAACAYSSERVSAGQMTRGGTDNDDEWVHSDSVLYTIRRLGIAKGEAGNKFYGSYNYTQTNFGSSCTVGTSGASVGNIAICGGYGNRGAAPFTTVCGGRNNKAGDGATDTSAIVVGGYGNRATAKFSAVISGRNNTASDSFASVGGGYANAATGAFATVGGGNGDTASDYHATVGGGHGNVASGQNATIGGGALNAASATCAIVGGGQDNEARGTSATVGGGNSNTASEYVSTVGGGALNDATGQYSTIGGGNSNEASGNSSTVGGGSSNDATGTSAAVGGGGANTASGYAATVPGGSGNAARGFASFAAGRYARANHRGSFVWSDSTATSSDSVYTTGGNQWRARARGGVWFYSNLERTTGVYLAGGSNTWDPIGSDDAMEDFRPVEGEALLEKVAALRVRDYKLKDGNDGSRHIGPAAQDFHSAFGYGATDAGINTADADGVALAAIQALYAQNQQLFDQNRQMMAELEALKAELKRE